MKKFFYLLLMLPLAMIATSCDDDDDKIPDVGINANVSSGVVKDGVIYIVKGEPLVIDQITFVNHTNKDGAIGAVTYYWDRMNIGTAVVSPYSIEISPDLMPVGRHLLQASMPIYVVDYPICFGDISYYVEVVESETDMPAQPDAPTVTGQVSAKE